MKKILLQKVIAAGKAAQQTIGRLSAKGKAHLEDNWDVEHAYYSSALEGSKIDKKEFEKLAQEIK